MGNNVDSKLANKGVEDFDECFPRLKYEQGEGESRS